ncbi:MAG: NUDIX hydrolase, partial [Jiangellaceae bacterium]
MPGSSNPPTNDAGDRRARKRSRGDRSARRRLRTVHETSAGGLVVDQVQDATQAALIGRVDRRGRLEWVLPKGHLEAGETWQQAAIREVREETGLDSRVIEPLGEIDYWFVEGDRRIHKTVHHFVLEAVGGTLGTDDVEVSEVAWVPIEELIGRLRYASERRLIRQLPGIVPGLSSLE